MVSDALIGVVASRAVQAAGGGPITGFVAGRVARRANGERLEEFAEELVGQELTAGDVPGVTPDSGGLFGNLL